MKHQIVNSMAALALGLTATFAKAEYANSDLLVSTDALYSAIADRSAHGATLDGQPLVLIDVRPPKAYASGHIPGAVNIAPDAVAARGGSVAGALRPLDEVTRMLADLGVSAKSRVVFYDDRGGFHAARMFWLAEYLGHQNVSLLNGGLSAWVSDIGPLETGATLPRPVQGFAANVSPRRHASADWIVDRRGDPDVVVIDVRSAKAFAKGHIPWAINLPWARNLNPDSTMKSQDDLRDNFASAGIGPQSNVVIHCEIGSASAHSYFALRLIGHPRVRVYHRSWSEWGRDSALPRAEGA